MEIRVPVTNYVYKYLVRTYGSGPYYLALNRTNDLRLSFCFLQLQGEPVLREEHLPGRYIILNLEGDSYLERVYKMNKKQLESGLFFAYEFSLISRKWIEAQLALQLPDHNKLKALQSFLDYYGISEDDYSLDSAYRQLTRKLQLDQVYIAEKLTRKYDFRHDRNDAFKLATFNPRTPGGRVEFYCYSRTLQDVRRYQHRVPPRYSEDELKLDYALTAMRIINSKLLDGFSAN